MTTGAHDDDRLREALAEAEEANRLKDEFLAVLSHELRTPLNAILGWARMLRSGTLRADDVPRAIETIERNAQAQTQLVNDLLDVSRAISGKVRLDVQSMDLSHVVLAAIDSMQPAADAKGIQLQASLRVRQRGIEPADLELEHARELDHLGVAGKLAQGGAAAGKGLGGIAVDVVGDL